MEEVAEAGSAAALPQKAAGRLFYGGAGSALALQQTAVRRQKPVPARARSLDSVPVRCEAVRQSLAERGRGDFRVQLGSGAGARHRVRGRDRGREQLRRCARRHARGPVPGRAAAGDGSGGSSGCTCRGAGGAQGRLTWASTSSSR